MQDQEDPDKNSQLSVPTPPVPPNTETSAGMPIPDPLTAIRQEVFNNLGDGTEHAEELRGLTERLEQLESRANKQQQDLTALLNLCDKSQIDRLSWKKRKFHNAVSVAFSGH